MQNRLIVISGLFAVAIATGMSTLHAQDQVTLDSDQKKYSYAVGTKIAQQLAQQFDQPDSGIDIMVLMQGIVDTMSGNAPMMNEMEAEQAIQTKQRAEFEAAAKVALDTEDRGRKYREQNVSKEGVTETASGIQYSVISAGEGTSPSASDTVVVHYKGSLIDGTEFDSSYSRGEPATFPVSGVIPGWQELLQLMKPGDKWSVVIPPDQAYGERGAGSKIGPNETLLFDIELLEIK